MKNFILFLSILSLLAAGILVFEAAQFMRTEFPDTSKLKTMYPIVHYHGEDDPFTITLSRMRPSNWVSLSEISKPAVGAIIVSEDWAFYQHNGYDPKQIKEAIKEDWQEGSFVRGASTITQQVVKNVFLEKDKNLWRKIKELFLAVQLEEKVGKKRILETYLNIAEWGEGLFGIDAAAHFYFHKTPAELTAKEGAFLAMLLPSPKRYAQSYRAKHLTDYARETVDTILSKMTQAHYLSESERDMELARPLSFESVPSGSL